MGCLSSKNALPDSEDLVSYGRSEDLKKSVCNAAGAVEHAEECNFEAASAGLEVALLAGAEDNAAAVAGTVVAVAGEALMELGKSLPWVAPVAILIGACFLAARNAYILQEDCRKFKRLVQQLETIMLQAKLDGAKAVCEDLKMALEEGLAQCKRCSKRYSIILAKRYSDKFMELTQDIQRLAQLLSLSATVDVHNMLSVQYTQSSDLKAKITAMGGPDAIMDDESGGNAIQAFLSECSAAEQLMVAHQRKSTTLLRQHTESMAVKTEAKMSAMQKQMEQLTSYLTKVFDAEIAEPTREVVHDFMAKRPVNMHEDEQEQVLKSVGLSNGNWAWHGNKSFHELLGGAVKAFDAPVVWLATIDQEQWRALAMMVRKDDGSPASCDAIVGTLVQRSITC